jgi:hypothetical protein
MAAACHPISGQVFAPARGMAHGAAMSNPIAKLQKVV